MKKTFSDSPIEEEQDKKTFLALIIAAFGILLFIALALTLPWAK